MRQYDPPDQRQHFDCKLAARHADHPAQGALPHVRYVAPLDLQVAIQDSTPREIPSVCPAAGAWAAKRAAIISSANRAHVKPIQVASVTW